MSQPETPYGLIALITRSVVTIGIWALLFGIVRSMTSTSDGSEFVIVTGIIAATVLTIFLWVGEIAQSMQQGLTQEKAKNTGYGDNSAQLLLSLMSDEERQQLRSRLVNNMDDGEIVPLEELAYQERQDY